MLGLSYEEVQLLGLCCCGKGLLRGELGKRDVILFLGLVDHDYCLFLQLLLFERVCCFFKFRHIIKDKKIGTFTLRHQVLTDFPPKELRNVVDQSKKDIKERLGHLKQIL